MGFQFSKELNGSGTVALLGGIISCLVEIYRVNYLSREFSGDRC